MKRTTAAVATVTATACLSASVLPASAFEVNFVTADRYDVAGTYTFSSNWNNKTFEVLPEGSFINGKGDGKLEFSEQETLRFNDDTYSNLELQFYGAEKVATLIGDGPKGDTALVTIKLGQTIDPSVGAFKKEKMSFNGTETGPTFSDLDLTFTKVAQQGVTFSETDPEQLQEALKIAGIVGGVVIALGALLGILGGVFR